MLISSCFYISVRVRRLIREGRAVTMTDITSWSEEQATEWAVKEFGEEIAKKFEGKYKLFSLYVCVYMFTTGKLGIAT